MNVTEIVWPELDGVPGWLIRAKCEEFERLFKIIAGTQPHCVAVEIGVFYGKSALAQGLLLEEIFDGNGMLYAIDPWTKEAALEGENAPENDDWWSSTDYGNAMDYFVAQIINLRLMNVIEVVVAKSEEVVVKIENDFIDLLHIDGNHSAEKSLQDVELWLPKVKIGGFIVLDDTNWPTVTGAMNALDKVCTLVSVYDKDSQAFNVYQKK